MNNSQENMNPNGVGSGNGGSDVHKGGANDYAQQHHAKKMVTIGSTRSSFVMLAFSLVMTIALAITILDAGDARKLMTFKWTSRLTDTPTYDQTRFKSAFKRIEEVYTNNFLSTKAALANVITENYKAAGCLAAHFDGGIEWGPGSVSPTCHCLRNFHIEYIKAVTPNGVPLTEAEMRSADTKTKVETMLRIIKQRCFVAIRHTQFEQTEESLGSNLVVVAACWNAIAMCCFLYMYKNMNRISMLHSDMMTTLMFVLVGIVSLLSVVAGFVADGGDSTAIGVVQCIASLLYCLVILVYTTMQGSRLGPWTTYWYACLFFLPFLAQGVNAVMQRRDAWSNHNTGIIMASICLVSAAIGFLHADNHQHMHSIKSLCAASTGLLVISVFTFTFPSFPTTPFFNMQFTIFCVAILMAFPAIYNVIFLHKSFSTLRSWWSVETPTESFYEVFVVEFVARVIFTFSVMSDLWSMKGTDFDMVMSKLN